MSSLRTLDFYASETLAIQGDSITTPYSWWRTLATTLTARYTATPSPLVISPSTGPLVIPPGGSRIIPPRASDANLAPNISIFGHSGQGIDFLLAHEAEVIAVKPTVIFIEIGTNDIPSSTMQPKYTQLITDYQTALPGVRIACLSTVSVAATGEQWNPDTSAGVINQMNTQMAAACDATGAAYFDIRGPEQAYEAINNPTNLVIGNLTRDGLHPSDPVGIDWWSNTVLGYLILHGTLN